MTEINDNNIERSLAEYSYYPDGSIKSLKQLNGLETRYSYDALNCLAQVAYLTYTETSYYDKAGNRTKRIPKDVEELYSYDNRNRLMSLTTTSDTGTKIVDYHYD